ncbi:GNAT family N-acetyltransferase [Pelagibacterium sp. 26DY04]|uniref:GNAT family N-acetyltransferase n=1 Tax=Pelagibacterium sp. 26DY04 TaxID=2967130 RepID=UPI002816810A|nr:GNAT family N-acetyltransferase [Pelagibacterium sp. 26DY04]WMT86931.1 GNAT family N-acetyltransferase [Pelagibacterium sp. 26DY04]
MTQPAGILVRVIGEADLDLLLSADTSVFDEPVKPDLAKAYLAHPDYLIALATDGDKVVGMATGLFYFHPDKHPEFYVNEVGVAESHQRRGIGKKLMAVLLDAAAARGVTYGWVATETDNLPARSLYEAIGGKSVDMVYFELNLSKHPDQTDT